MAHVDIWIALAAPWPQSEVKTRPQGGRQLSYLTARQVMNRLDEVLSPENWWDEYQPLEHSVICRLTIRLPDGTTLTKSDAGGHAGMTDAGDDEKSGFSDAFKRSAVKFGIGRYLYGDGTARFKKQPDAKPPLEPDRKPMPGRPSNPAPAPDAHHAKNNPNNTGHGSGAYADPEIVKQFTAWARTFCEEVNAKWLDLLTDEQGEIRKGPSEIVNSFQLAAHLIKWGRVAHGLNAPEEIRAGSRDKYAAVLWGRDQASVIKEAREYCWHLWCDHRAKLDGASPDDDRDVPDPTTDAEIQRTEAGARG